MSAQTACSCGTCPACTGNSPRPVVADPIEFSHAAIRKRMLDAIATTEIDGTWPLSSLRTRDTSDPAVALIDAFAGSLHILAYNAARLSDDSSILRTQDRDALVRLTRMLGYEPRPAMSATATLAFLVNALDGAPKDAVVPEGTKIMSVPVEQGQPQSFETLAALDARAEWNALLPVIPMRPYRVRAAISSVRIKGTATTAKVGDVVLAFMSEQPQQGSAWLCGRIAAIKRIAEKGGTATDPVNGIAAAAKPAFTILQLRSTLVVTSPFVGQDLALKNKLVVLAERAAAFGSNAPDIKLLQATTPNGLGNLWDKDKGDWANLQMLVSGADTASDKRTIFFGTSGPTATAKAEIEAILGDYAKQRPVAIKIAGYTDSSRPEAVSLQLSQKRAQAVADQLISDGIAAELIQVEGYGNRDPAVETAPGTTEPKNERVEITMLVQADTIDLDAVHPEAMRDKLVLFESDRGRADKELGTITEVVERSRSDFGLSAKVSRVTLEGIDLGDNADTSFNKRVRETAIFIETGREDLLEAGEELILPRKPFDRLTVSGKQELTVGKHVILRGELCCMPAGTMDAEEAIVTAVTPTSDGDTLLVFAAPLAKRFSAATLVVLGNCVDAGHGATVSPDPELLGSSDIQRLTPRFQLKNSPLSYVPAANARGYEPALEVRVSDRLYEAVPTLWGTTNGQRSYTVVPVENAATELQFAGRLPTGTNNVTAAYRVGSGKGGNVAAGQLKTIATPVVGVTGVGNPMSAEGGSDAETLEDMRTSAPQSIRTLDRAVSLSDFEVFARRYRGVGKALASELDVGMRKVVCLTLADTEFDPMAESSETVTALSASLARASVPGRLIWIKGFEDLPAAVDLAIISDPALLRENVERTVRSALADHFSRDRRGFGQPLHRSEILAVAQAVEGVTACRIVSFGFQNVPSEPGQRLMSPAPRIDGGTFREAGLIWIDPRLVTIEEAW